MSSFNRNIITTKDAEHLRTATTATQIPPTFREAPPAGQINGLDGPPPAPPAGDAEVADEKSAPRPDDYLTKLLKYVPPEVVATYVAIVGIITGNVPENDDLRWWLAITLVVMLALTGVYGWRVLGIVRPAQISVTVLGLAVYAFAFGGWFATTTWYKPWHGTIALMLFGFLVAVVRLKPLTPSSEPELEPA